MNLFAQTRLPRLPAPVLPEQVYATAYTFNATLHCPCDVGPLNIGRARCGWLNTAALTRPTDQMRRYQPTWCADCWPLRRCTVCAAPSGSWAWCRTCTTAIVAAETDLDRAAEYNDDDQGDR